MQSGKNAVESMKESAANVAASAKSGMNKTQATVQEKVDRMTAHNPAEKEMATERKEQRIAQAELGKQEAIDHNASTKEAAIVGTGTHQGYRAAGTGTGTATYSTTGAPGHPTGAHQGTGQVTEGVGGAHPVGTNTGTKRPSATHNTHVEGGAGAQGYGTGGYSA